MKKLKKLSAFKTHAIPTNSMRGIYGGLSNDTGGMSVETSPPDCNSDTKTSWDDEDGSSWYEICYEGCLCPST